MDKIIDRFLKFLMIIVTVWLINHVWTGRYEVYGAGQNGAYKLDTWSGQTTFLYGPSEKIIEMEKVYR